MFCFLGNATHFDKCITLIAIARMFRQEQNVQECDATMFNSITKSGSKKSLKCIQLWKIPGEILSKKLQ